jgi:hypothetical protein
MFMKKVVTSAICVVVLAIGSHPAAADQMLGEPVDVKGKVAADEILKKSGGVQGQNSYSGRQDCRSVRQARLLDAAGSGKRIQQAENQGVRWKNSHPSHRAGAERHRQRHICHQKARSRGDGGLLQA